MYFTKKNILTITILIFTHTIYSLSEVQLAEIQEVVKISPDQMSMNERIAIAEVLIAKAPCNCLIFGVGNDSQLWINFNQNGRTAFLEDNQSWLELVQNKIENLEAYTIAYNTKITDWKMLLNKPALLMLELPANIQNCAWDVIIVDAPTGFNSKSTGRMKSIFSGWQLATQGTNVDVFVHDCNRNVEKVYTDTFLQPQNLVQQTDRLRHYKIN